MNKLKYSIFNVGGEVVRDDDNYVVKDNKFLSGLILSSTDLNPGKSTRGHSHAGQEEIYFFSAGTGNMEIDSEVFEVRAGDVVLIPDGAFHRVHNPTKNMLRFVCVFDGKRNH